MNRGIIRSFRRFFHQRSNPRWAKLETTLGVRIYDFTLFEKALRHPSAERAQNHGLLQSYERLEFLGDAILDCVVAEHLYHEFPEEMEGFMTAMRSKLVRGETCATIARNLGLGEFIELDHTFKSRGGHSYDSVLADCLESIIGAIHLDRGITVTRKFIHQNLLDQLDLGQLATRDDNYKSRLQELVQGNWMVGP